MDRLVRFTLKLFFFTAPFTAFTPFQELTPIITTTHLIAFLTGCVLVGWLFTDISKIKIDNNIKIIGVSFLLPIFFSLIWMLFSIIIEPPSSVAIYLKEVLTRTLGLTTYISIVSISNNYIKKLTPKQLKQIAKVYLFSLLILVAIGWWQWLHFYLGFPFVEIQSRTNFHGLKSTLYLLFPKRLTSLTDEPSFLAPFMLDVIILGFGLVKKYQLYLIVIFLPTTWVLIFSFSFGGYANALLLILVYIILLNPIKTVLIYLQKNVSSLLFILTALMVGFILMYPQIYSLVKVFYGRLGGIFGSGRWGLFVTPWQNFLESKSFLTSVLGHGPGAYGAFFGASSTNMFTDLIFDVGFFGLVLSFIFFLFFFLKGLKNIRATREHRSGTLLISHLFITSLYRTDFAATRFWVVTLTIILLYEIGDRSIKGRKSIKQPVLYHSFPDK